MRQLVAQQLFLTYLPVVAHVRLTLPAGPIPEALFESPGFLLAWLSERLVERYGAALAELGLRPAHHAVLLAVADLQPVRQARLRERLRIDHATFVTTVNALEERQMLAREADPADRRTLVLRLTADGRALLERTEAQMRRIEERELATLGEQGRVRLTRSLASVVRQLTAADGDGDKAAA